MKIQPPTPSKFQLILHKLRYKNFRSVGNSFIEIELDRFQNTICWGQNGVGKTTLYEALTFGLYGRPYSNTNKPTLVNDINDRDCLVEIEMTVKGISYLIKRGIKPAIFEIYKNGKLVPQDAKSKDQQKDFERDILQIPFKVFKQIIVLGSANYKPFMELSAADRRFVIEDLLDIQIFSKMNVLLKQKVVDAKEEMKKIDNEIELTKEKLRLNDNHITSIRSNQKVRIAEIQLEITNFEKQQKDNTDSLFNELSSENFSDYEKQVKSLESKINKTKHLLDSFDQKVQKLNQDLEFYKTLSNCPTCEQIVLEHHKDKIITDLMVKLQTLACNRGELLTKQTFCKQDHFVLKQKLDTCQSYMNDNYNLDYKIEVLKKEIAALERSLKTNNTDLYTKRDNLKIGLAELAKKKDSLQLDKHYNDVMSILLKDSGIKTKIIRKYLPILNRRVNTYLTEMNFFVHFELDENFNEVIKVRGVYDYIYEKFSQGEKLRIDIALITAWRDLAKIKNSINCNLIILDEILDRAIDQTGLDDFFNLMWVVWKDLNTFIISPKGEAFTSKFQNSIKFEKVNNFARIAEHE